MSYWFKTERPKSSYNNNKRRVKRRVFLKQNVFKFTVSVAVDSQWGKFHLHLDLH